MRPLPPVQPAVMPPFASQIALPVFVLEAHRHALEQLLRQNKFAINPYRGLQVEIIKFPVTQAQGTPRHGLQIEVPNLSEKVNVIQTLDMHAPDDFHIRRGERNVEHPYSYRSVPVVFTVRPWSDHEPSRNARIPNERTLRAYYMDPSNKD